MNYSVGERGFLVGRTLVLTNMAAYSTVDNVYLKDPRLICLGYSPFYTVLQEAGRLHASKNVGYANPDDHFANFRAAEQLGIKPLAGVLVRMSDKWARVGNLWRTDGKADFVGEKLRDTLLDLGVYALIAVALLDEEKNNGLVSG